MLSLPAKAIQRQQENGWVKAYIFDILYYAEEAIYTQDFSIRWDCMTRCFKEWVAMSCLFDATFPEFVELAETHHYDKGEHLAEWMARGEEGGVLKMLTSTAKTSAAHHVREIGATAARPMNTTFKIKQVDTVDVVIMDIQLPGTAYTGKDPDNHPYKDADGKAINRLYALNMINAFVIGVYMPTGELRQIGTVASGLDDELRLAAWDDADEYRMKVIEVDCMSIDKVHKTLRHPRLMRFRPDKDHTECTVGNTFG
jgi:ATP-dependent DNA ligase